MLTDVPVTLHWAVDKRAEFVDAILDPTTTITMRSDELVLHFGGRTTEPPAIEGDLALGTAFLGKLALVP